MGAYLGSRSPRRLMAAVGAGMGLANGVFTGIQADEAPPLKGAPPEVDRLSVTVVTDSYHHNFEASGKFAGTDVQRYTMPPSNEPPRRILQNEWGLELLNLDPSKLDAMVLSHGHYDHFGGMVGFLQAHRRKLKPALPFYLGGEECFCARETGPANAPRNFGVLDRRAIADANLRVLFAEKPSLVAGHGFTSGWISKVSFEKPAQPSRMKVGIGPDGMGCAAARLPEEKRSAEMMIDDFQHEQATCFHVKGKGLVVMTSCGHRGVVNTVEAAIKVSGVSKVHAILGGFHLMPMSAEYAQETARAMARFDADCLIPMHCSGENFFDAAKQAMPGRVVRTSTGTRFTFGSA